MLRKLANFAGAALKKVGEIGSAALKPIGTIAASGAAQSLANKVIDTLPVPEIGKTIARGAVSKAAEFVTSGRAQQLLDKAKMAGTKLQDLSEG